MAIGIRYSFGVFFISILKDYGWSRADTAGAFSLAMVVHALFAPVTGTLIDRLGPRKLFPAGALFLILGLLAASRVSTLWQLYVTFGVVMAMGINTLSYSPHMSLIPKWFLRKRGLATGLVLSGVGLGTLVMLPLVEAIIDAKGWRSAFLVLAALVLVVVLPLTAFFQRRSPQEMGQLPDGGGQVLETSRPSEPKDAGLGTLHAFTSEPWTLNAALHSSAFWHLMLVVFCNGFLINMLLVHQAVHTVDAGYGKMTAASLVGVVGLIGSVGGIFCGYLSDRIGRETSYTLGSAAAFLGVALFVLIKDTGSPWMLVGFVLFYGIGLGSIGPMTASATGDLFPGNSLGRILAVQSMGFGLGGALGPYVGGYFHDHTGSYAFPFLLLLVSIALGVLGMWWAAPRRSTTGSIR